MKNIAIIGSGTMGNGIAHVFAQNDFQVSLCDISPEALSKALATIEKNLDRQIQKATISEETKQKALQNINTYTLIAEAVHNADLVIEAVSENIQVKLEVFKDIDHFAPEHTILASNTSSISITKIAANTRRPDKVIGMHFFNPVPIMKLVEVIKGYATSEETTQKIKEISEKIGKIAVEVNDYPGFVANRILMPMLNEAFYTLYEGVAGVEEIDTIMKLGMAHPMGPLQLADFIGLDICLDILRVMHTGLGNPKYAPCPLLVNMVEAGHKGVKSGIGFYDYSHGGKNLVVSPRFAKNK
ncbi:MAG: 3-hydroxybutyryl-CoA dehydrogenase [Microscillaceae bacterium]|nr:3-hydroxybutyryl-CoA dehydrogenase [Microscillaceae bacterium]MDW8460852.1 3-hydroxybutyryl-CoA dehydrogenase [Cytophagales bacterium]